LILIILRENLRVLIEKLRSFLKRALLLKPKAFVPLILFIALLLFAAIFALTQESPDDIGRSGSLPDDYSVDDASLDFSNDEISYNVWIPPGPPRWFRSNAGGMTLEETKSRLVALRNKYALVIDYISPDEVEPRLLPYYEDAYTVEIRILYEEGVEIRRQWLFNDKSGITRLNAVFRTMPDVLPEEIPADEDAAASDEALASEGTAVSEEDASSDEADPIIDSDEAGAQTASADNEKNDEALGEIALAETDTAGPPPTDDGMPDIDPRHVAGLIGETALSLGFIERYNNKAQIIEDSWLFDDDSIIRVTYSYNGGVMLKAETNKMLSGSEFKAVYTDNYRYNRAYSLRNIERVYHESSVPEPVRMNFPGRVLQAAADDQFLGDKLSLVTDFMGNFFVGEGFRVIYDTDNRGRVLSQTMIDKSNEVVWVLKNTWAGDRIISSLKTEGDDIKLTEYEYNEGGERVVQRDMHNGVLERVVYTKGANETEELYMNGVLVLKAYWEDGRKISEERVRRR
jgi:hypothetical protein